MSLLYLPARLSALFSRPLARTSSPDRTPLPAPLLGVLFARGRRTVTSWFRAVGITQEYKQAYRDVAAAGRSHEHKATAVLSAVERLLQPQDDLLVAIDDTPTPRWGPWVEGAGIHHNPNPGPGRREVPLWSCLGHAGRSAGSPRAGGTPCRCEPNCTRGAGTSPRPWRCQGIAFATKLQQAANSFSGCPTHGRPRPAYPGGRRRGLCQTPALGGPSPLATDPGQPATEECGVVDPPFVQASQGTAWPPADVWQAADRPVLRRAQNPRGWQEVSCVQYREKQTRRIKTFVATWAPRVWGDPRRAGDGGGVAAPTSART